MLTDQYLQLYNQLKTFIPESRLFTDPARTLAYGTDASFYRLTPKMVINVETQQELSNILRFTTNLKIPVTFRAAGTSLSGQAISDSVLLRLTSHWKQFHVHDHAEKISLQPGIIGSHANRILAPFNKKIGPDPASINAAMIGGIAANNASGMCCGTSENSYKTLDSVKVVLGDGTFLDTGDPESRDAFRESKSELLKAIEELGEKTRANTALAEKIRHKFKIKNTTGYSLNSLVDFTDPFDILQHLLIGSEGTLGCMTEVTYKTVPEHPNKASALIIFPDIERACQATQILTKQPVSAVELMDRPALRSVENQEGMPDYLKTLSDTASALLVETRAEKKELLDFQIDQINQSLESIEKVLPVEFTPVPEEYTKLWNIRKGLFPSVGAVRETGTTVIIEDVAFPIEHLADATLELQSLLQKYKYDEAIIFGHARDGNLHFVFTQDFSSEEEIQRYAGLMDDVADMVVHKYDGSLKAEHGTGRNMAPFVEMEWGTAAYQLMEEIKKIFDPEHLLNPGVILNDDSKAHLKDLKPLPPADPLVDKCIECGFCEEICPAKNVTFTPRQRITTWREISRLTDEGASAEQINELLLPWDYLANQTCATDSLCATSCPVGIDTGKFIKSIRAKNNTDKRDKNADWVSGHFSTIAGLAKTGLGLANISHRLLGTGLFTSLTTGMRKISSGKIPQWNPWLPTSPKPFKSTQPANLPKKIVYFPSCVSRNMGPAMFDPEKDPLVAKTVSLLNKAGYEVLFPITMDELCCGQAFESKGFVDQANQKSSELNRALMEISNQGEIPVYCDTSPCLYRMKETLDKKLELYEPIEFIHKFLKNELRFTKTDETITIHSTCTSRKMGLDQMFKEVADLCTDKVIVPEDVNCCGFAGDKGFHYPELNKSALQGLAIQVKEAEAGYSTSRTCEIGLSLHGEKPYKSIVYLVDKCTSSL